MELKIIQNICFIVVISTILFIILFYTLIYNSLYILDYTATLCYIYDKNITIISNNTYKGNLYINYGVFSTDYNNIMDAQNYLNTFPEYFRCYYNDHSVILKNPTISEEKIQRNWIYFVIFGILPLVISLIILTYYIFLSVIIIFILWVGFIIPLCILLPIWIYGILNPIQYNQLNLSIISLFCIGNGTLILYTLYRQIIQGEKEKEKEKEKEENYNLCSADLDKS